MNNDLTIIEQTLTIPSAGETEAGSARDSRPGVTDYRRGGRPQADRPAHFPRTGIQNSPMPEENLIAEGNVFYLTVSGKCPFHAEPLQRHHDKA